jgi:hypothetical protein
MKTRQGKIVLHVLGSICFLSLPILFSPNSLANSFAASGFVRDFFTYVFLLIIFYAFYFFVVPKFFLTRKYILFALITLLSFVVVVVAPAIISGPIKLGMPQRNGPPELQFQPPSGPPPGMPQGQFAPPQARPMPDHEVMHRPGIDPPPLLHQIERNVFRFVIVLVIAILLCVSKRLKQAQQDKLDAELSYLKAQINPHFLFNTLNSIYSLAITRSELTAAAVLKLSEMMRYVTTEAHSELVLLEKEINYVSNYIELQRIRLGKTVRIDYQTTGTSGQKRIAPLVLIPFVENAFKYGVNPEEESVVTIRITITAQKLTMFVGNKIVKIDVLDEYKSGHGMDNVSQRLQIGYPGKHKLNVSREGDEYHVNLELDL